MAAKISPEQEILDQMLIAFGQGLGYIRVPRATCATIHENFLGFLQQDHCQERIHGKEDVWGQADHGSQVLERVRAVGRLAAQTAAAAGHTTVTDGDFQTALTQVQEAQDCDWCQSKPMAPHEPRK